MLLIPIISPSQYTTLEDCKYICIPCNCLAIWKYSPRLNMGTTSASSIAVHEVLTQDNYLDWCVRVKTYLQAQNLWHVVGSQKNPPQFEINRRAYNEWNKKNVMALHVIQISCGPETFSTIRRDTKARIAWKNLEDMYKPKFTKSRRTTNEISSAQIDSDSTTEENNTEYLDSRTSINSGKGIHWKNAHYELCKHLKSGDWDKTKDLLVEYPKILGKNITVENKKLLHLAVFAGHDKIVQKLVEPLSGDDLVYLEKRDRFGCTALAETTLHGNYEMAECMIEKNDKLVRIPSYKKLLPVVLAVFHKHIKLARYLYRRTPLKDLLAENGLNGVTLMIQVMHTGDFDIALDLIRCNQNLAFALDREECSPLSALASMPHAFKRSKLVFWKQWIYDSISAELPPKCTINETRVNIPKEERQNSNEVNIVDSEEKRHDFNGVSIVESVPEPLRQPVPYLSELLGIQGLHKMKWNDMYSREILRLMCENISPLNEKEQNDVISVAIFRAVKEGFKEFVDKVLEANPQRIWARDQQWVSLVQQAVLYREAEIFMLLHKKPGKNSVMNLKDEFRNNVLHMAGFSTPSTRFKCIQGAVLQMQRELQWFKELEQIVHPKMKEERNNSGLTPQELFTSEHNDMKNKGEDWMKNTASSCSVVAALIATIMFAAAFTVPGGNDQNTGLPTFLNRKLFKLFIVSDALSLFSSSTSVLMFLGILTSRYEEEDFLESLPKKLIIGLFTLFFSIAAMMTAFSSALLLMLRGQSWIVLPAICFAGIPVIVFAFMQFPLLLDLYRSTFGPKILIPKKKG